MAEELIVIARIERPRGRRGEVAARLETDFPERFSALRRLWLVTGTDRSLVELEERPWLHKGRVVLKIAGVDDIAAAERLRGARVAVPESEAVALPEGTFFHHQLIGLRVEDAREGPLGRVADVLRAGPIDHLVVATHRGELLIPTGPAFCRDVDLEAGVIRTELPEGLTEP